jgi:glycosyltransferase involved in cell wall biosynthesis
MPERELLPLEAQARRNQALAGEFGGPLFVSTPDLLRWLPAARWCPVAVDFAAWEAPPTDLARPVPVVLHAPSNAARKGTAAARAAVEPLARAGLVEYRELSDVPPAEMPAAVRGADIVLELFALGSYGVTAAQAMAAGRVVVGHVAPGVRAHVAAATGLELPIAEAPADGIGAVLEALLRDREAAASLAARGQRFASQVHDGAASAAALGPGFLDGGGGQL